MAKSAIEYPIEIEGKYRVDEQKGCVLKKNGFVNNTTTMNTNLKTNVGKRGRFTKFVLVLVPQLLISIRKRILEKGCVFQNSFGC